MGDSQVEERSEKRQYDMTATQARVESQPAYPNQRTQNHSFTSESVPFERKFSIQLRSLATNGMGIKLWNDKNPFCAEPWCHSLVFFPADSELVLSGLRTGGAGQDCPGLTRSEALA